MRKENTDEHEEVTEEEHEEVDNDIILEGREILMIFKRSQKNMTKLIISIIVNFFCSYLFMFISIFFSLKIQ